MEELYNSRHMKIPALCLIFFSAAVAAAQPAAVNAPERLGTVSFAVSCTPAVQPSFDRGVALLHDFWYAEAGPSSSGSRRTIQDVRWRTGAWR
jgi:hypothetical protein